MDHCRDTPGPPRNRCEEQSPKALQANQSGLQPPMLICTAKRQRELLFYVIFYIMHASSGTYVAHTIQHCTGCAYKNSGTYFLSCHQTTFLLNNLMRCSPNYVTSDEVDGENDNPLIFLYFGVQALQTLRQCKQNNAKLQKWKIYFPIMFAWEKAYTRTCSMTSSSSSSSPPTRASSATEALFSLLSVGD